MRRKNFILNIILFLFINILSFSNEKLPNVNTSINSMNPTYDESLKEYKIKLENTDLFYNYIQKKISEKGVATTHTKLEKGELIATDENNNIIFIEKLPENISEKTTYFESKQVYQLKNGKMLVNTNYILDSDGEKTKILSETLLKKNITGKNIFGIIDLMGDLSISLEKTFANIEAYKSDIYDENDELIFSATYKNKKIEAESEVDGTFMKMTYVFEDNNFNKGTINLYIDHKLFATVKVKDSLQDGEMKIFYPNGKVMGTSIFKNGKLNGVSKMYYENGKIMTKMNFKDDELEGEAIIYDEDGKILDKQFYKNGEEVIK
ncbi:MULTISPECIES: toxin-antitoxin system YwqK family antitoxin [Fusobacterium]|uniref:Phophatidylinositol-4-phosphate 5-kinase n=2 Tax=Fusobacterium TaxID=848 RepID=A0AAC8WLK5_9FUSO|nr:MULTISPECIES: toxin-antitoxin system YwqK family antitoxin [Fusobacterium]ALQ36268.1 phophatidylinositol-4-phosphate 5-kinase [Fusobacterium hwasookii ChDC F206]PHI16018.1 phosphatidylinositol-4-phosphate 5-kinase [Fusobacterium polymorphum]